MNDFKDKYIEAVNVYVFVMSIFLKEVNHKAEALSEF